jgi:thiol:disulfide interchange protein DsbC
MTRTQTHTISLTALTLCAIVALGCVSPKYEIVRTDKWIVKDGWIAGEKGKLNETSAIDGTDVKSAVKEERDGGNNSRYCDNDPKQSNNGDRNGRRVKQRLDDNAHFNFNRNTDNRFNPDRNATNRNSTLALYKGKPIEAIEEAWVKSVLPNTQIELIRRSPIVNLYTAFLTNGQIIYINPSQRLLFFGEIYTSAGDNLTNISRERFSELRTSKAALEINAAKLETLGFGEIGKEERFIVMVTSPLCPYCHRADEFLSSNQIPVKRIFLVNPQSPDNEDTKRAIEYLMTASKETREALLVKWRSSEGYEASKSADEALNEKTQEAINLLEAMREFAERNNIEGTPYIYLIDRKAGKVERVIAGYSESTSREIKAWYLSDRKRTNQAAGAVNGEGQ